VSLGSAGLKVSKQGFGCMGMSAFYTTDKVDENESIKVIGEALNRGVNFFDTADIYGYGDNEKLLGKAIKKYGREKFIVATKFTFIFDESDRKNVGMSGKPDHVKKACAASLRRLGIDTIDLYYQHRVDPNTPIEDTVKAMSELVKEGKVKYIGLSECGSDTLRKAHAIHPITAVQVEYSMWTPELEKTLFPTCRELGIGIVAYAPLGRGMLAGTITKVEDLEEDDWRKTNARFQGENFKKNLALVETVKKIANAKGCTPSQLAIAWVLHQGKDIVPIPGTKRTKYFIENVGANSITITSEEDKEIRKIMQSVVGLRYSEQALKTIGL